MTTGFSRTETGRVVVRLDELERAMLTSLAEQIIGLVTPVPGDGAADADPLAALVGISVDATTPEDPALARLLPDGYRDDPEAAGDFRRFTELDLRQMKLAHARTVIACLERSGEKITLTDDECASWLGLLNDARLALGTRVGITDDNHDELAAVADDDPRLPMLQVYDWLSYLEASLVQVLLP